MKPGDVVAVKSTGNPKNGKGFLEIIAYAVVVERNGKTYWFDPVQLGHCVNVVYMKTHFKHYLPLGGYGRYSAEGDHVVPWQTEHVFGWRTSAANAVSAFQS